MKYKITNYSHGQRYCNDTIIQGGDHIITDNPRHAQLARLSPELFYVEELKCDDCYSDSKEESIVEDKVEELVKDEIVETVEEEKPIVSKRKSRKNKYSG